MKLKLDLHTHCQEAMSYTGASPSSARRILQAVKAKGLDGIAITEHNKTDFAFKIREIIEKELGSEIIIIPGQELDTPTIQLVELYFPERLVFTFLAHPGFPSPIEVESYLGQVQGIEIRNGAHELDLNMARMEALARRYNLLLLSNSDAHDLQDIGSYYNVIEMEEIRKRARRG